MVTNCAHDISKPLAKIKNISLRISLPSLLFSNIVNVGGRKRLLLKNRWINPNVAKVMDPRGKTANVHPQSSTSNSC